MFHPLYIKPTLFFASDTIPPRLDSNPPGMKLLKSLVRWHSQLSLRPYQREAIDLSLKSLSENYRRVAVSMATGSGKTVIFAHLIPEIPPNPSTGGSKTLILVHRTELVRQAMEKLSEIHPDMVVDKDIAKHRAQIQTSDVIVASVPTLARTAERLNEYDPRDFKAIIIDECHHAVSPSFYKVIQHFGGDRDKSSVAVVGFSATLQRHDKVPLSSVFDYISYHKDVAEMIDQGYLCDPQILTIGAMLNLSSVETTSKDYKTESLAKHVNTDEINEIVLKSYITLQRQHKWRSTLFFCVNVQHLKDLSDLFRKYGIDAQYVTGETGKDDRASLISEFKEGKLPVLMNCGVFTEGTDIPNIDSLFLVRPTKSTPLLIQMVGRGLRKHPQKKTCHVVDFVDASETGMALDPTLVGAHTTSKEPLFPPDGIPRRSCADLSIELASELDMREYTGLQSFLEAHQYVNDRKAAVEKERKERFAKFIHHKYPWVNVGRHSWALSLSMTRYLRVFYADGLYTLKSYSSGNWYAKSPVLKESIYLDEIFQQVDVYLAENEDLKDVFVKSLYMSGSATPKQKSFLSKKLTSTASKSSKINMQFFKENIGQKLDELSKKDASQLIFAHTVGGNYPLEMFIQRRVIVKGREGFLDKPLLEKV